MENKRKGEERLMGGFIALPFIILIIGVVIGVHGEILAGIGASLPGTIILFAYTGMSIGEGIDNN